MHLLQKILFTSIIQLATSKTICKVTPASLLWPSVTEWQKLNSSISGNLLKPLPPGSVCDPLSPNFNNESCTYVFSQYSNASFHAADLLSGDYPNWSNDSCLPDPQAGCSQAGYSVYVINATNKDYVKEGVNFARTHNIRLIVKGTGHDFLGR